MDDLVSRQAVIDLLKKNVSRDIEDVILTDKYIRLIREMPVAYNVDAVVAELDKYPHGYLNVETMGDICDIVKRGGVE